LIFVLALYQTKFNWHLGHTRNILLSKYKQCPPLNSVNVITFVLAQSDPIKRADTVCYFFSDSGPVNFFTELLPTASELILSLTCLKKKFVPFLNIIKITILHEKITFLHENVIFYWK